VSASEHILLQSAMTEGGIAAGLNRAIKQRTEEQHA
jgi:hypothetical protein